MHRYDAATLPFEGLYSEQPEQAGHCNFPTFELVGPACPVQDCKGVMIALAGLKVRRLFERCSICGHEVDAFQSATEGLQAIEAAVNLLPDED